MKGAFINRMRRPGRAAPSQNHARRLAPDQTTETAPMTAKIAVMATKRGIGGAPGSPARGRARTTRK